MRIREVLVSSLEIPMKKVFSTSRAKQNVAKHIIVQLFSDDGLVILYAEQDDAALRIGEGDDILVDVRPVPLLELDGKSFALADQQFDSFSVHIQIHPGSRRCRRRLLS